MDGKTVFSFSFGSPDLYKALDHNPEYYAAPFTFVNDPRNIAKNRHMISINSTMSFNLFGEAAADCIGWKQQSGTGGQGDFVRGAQWSEGGKSIIATSSSFMKNGKRISKIRHPLRGYRVRLHRRESPHHAGQSPGHDFPGPS